MSSDPDSLNRGESNMKIVMLGAPGAGKGTQADKIADQYGLPHISTGDIFRKNIKEGTELGKEAKGYMDAGKLVPDELTVRMLLDRVSKDDCSKGYILDGFPRTIPQAEALDSELKRLGENIDFAIDVEVPDQNIINRMSGRRACPKCNAIYHIEFIPDYNTSHQWYPYTNPKSDSCGCHWCITQTQSKWDSYITNGGKCAYYCWKAESKEALMAMNRDERWFSRWPRDQYRDAPINDYGKSLICIMVYPGDDGRPRFAHASSRYNHYNPGGSWDSSSRYGDCMVPQGDRGFQEILGILGITAVARVV